MLPFAGAPRIFGAQYAPMTTAPFYAAGPNSWWSRYLRRAFSVQQWDLEYTFYQLIYSFRSPARVYKLTQHRKQTKNQWARDDPAFFVLLLAFLGVAAVSFGVAYEYNSPLAYAWLVAQAWLGFVGSGAVLSTACWAAANKYMRGYAHLPHAGEQEVEWLYAWDVHCNASVAVLLLLFVAQFALLPLLMRDGLLSTLLANALYAVAISQYVYVTFSGYLGA